jgi:hypothetical protein
LRESASQKAKMRDVEETGVSTGCDDCSEMGFSTGCDDFNMSIINDFASCI